MEGLLTSVQCSQSRWEVEERSGRLRRFVWVRPLLRLEVQYSRPDRGTSVFQELRCSQSDFQTHCQSEMLAIVQEMLGKSGVAPA